MVDMSTRHRSRQAVFSSNNYASQKITKKKTYACQSGSQAAQFQDLSHCPRYEV